MWYNIGVATVKATSHMRVNRTPTQRHDVIKFISCLFKEYMMKVYDITEIIVDLAEALEKGATEVLVINNSIKICHRDMTVHKLLNMIGVEVTEAAYKYDSDNLEGYGEGIEQ